MTQNLECEEPAMYMSSSCSTSSPISGDVTIFNLAGWVSVNKTVLHYGFNLHFPDD